MSIFSCSAALYDLIEDEAEAISGYFSFLDNFKHELREDEVGMIVNIIEEEKDHIEKLRKIQER